MLEKTIYEKILEFAITRELEANQFYLALAEKMIDPQMKRTCKNFAAEELEHKAKLELEIIKTGRTFRADLDLSPPEIEGVMAELGDELDIEYVDLLVLAMEKEETSFRTYVDLAYRTRDLQSREIFLTLAEEEVHHKIRFENEYNTITKDL